MPDALVAQLVAVDSVNPSLVPGSAGEGPIVELLEARLRDSFDTMRIGPEDRPSLVAVPRGTTANRRSERTIVLNGHLDTVGVAGMPAPFAPRVEGDRLYGRGAADMKGGVAAMVVAAERLIASDARVVLALVADEEDANSGSEAVIAALPDLGVVPDVCIIGEPTDLALARSLRGFAVVSVRFAGRAIHSSQAELGVNALTNMGRFMHAVDEHDGGLMVTLASGGESAFVVPDRAECLVEKRTAPDEASGGLLEEVLELLSPEWDAEATLVGARDGWRMDTHGPAAALANRLGEALGTETVFDAPYWMEAPLWQAVCPTLICGPSGGGLHAVDEWVDLRQVRAYSDALVEVLSGAL